MSNHERANVKYTLRPEDMYFLLRHKLTAMFGESTINEGNYEREWQKFIRRNSKAGLVDSAGNLSAGLEQAIEPIRSYKQELILTNQFTHHEKIIARAAFYSSENGTTFCKRGGEFRREFELEFMADVVRREEVLRAEFDLGWFRFSAKPFSYQLDAQSTEEVMALGLGNDPIEFKRWVRAKALGFADMASAMNVFSQDDRIVIMGTTDVEFGKAVSITGSAFLGVLIKSVYLGGMQGYNLLSTSIDRLAEQSLWDYISDF